MAFSMSKKKPSGKNKSEETVFFYRFIVDFFKNSIETAAK
jgi:hypothetical protein